MAVCPVCGTTNPAAADVCAACAEPLAAAEHGREGDGPLPRLPDGGLAAAMPDWLRPEPVRTEADAPVPDPAVPGGPAAPVAPDPAGDDPALADPTTFLTADDLPAWLRALGTPAAPAALSAGLPASPRLGPAEPLLLPAARTVGPLVDGHPAERRVVAGSAAPAPAEVPGAAATGAPPPSESPPTDAAAPASPRLHEGVAAGLAALLLLFLGAIVVLVVARALLGW